jgi:hypothetical protein
MGAIALLVAHPATADSGRQFAGNYSVSNASQSGDTQTLTFALQVFNYSGSDVSKATVNLLDSNDSSTVYASFTGVTIAASRDVRLSRQITIPNREYYGWSQAAGPNVVIQFTDANGNSSTKKVELGPAPATP